MVAAKLIYMDKHIGRTHEGIFYDLTESSARHKAWLFVRDNGLLNHRYWITMLENA